MAGTAKEVGERRAHRAVSDDGDVIVWCAQEEPSSNSRQLPLLQARERSAPSRPLPQAKRSIGFGAKIGSLDLLAQAFAIRRRGAAGRKHLSLADGSASPTCGLKNLPPCATHVLILIRPVCLRMDRRRRPAN
jgi:hypothetical protein